MRVTRVELHPANSSNVAVLSFRDPQRLNPYNVRAIIGLDADNIVPKYYGVSGNSAASFHHLSLQDRELVMRIQLNPRAQQDESYSSLRDDLYKLIASSRTGLIQIRFLDGEDVVAAISGFVRKFEAPHFERTPEVQLTIDPTDPMLRALDPVNVDISGLDPLLTTIVDNVSTAPHGFEFGMSFLGFVATFSITNPFDSSWSFDVSPVGGFGAGDVLHFSSDPKDKKLHIERGPIEIPLADVIAPGSVWPILFPEDNPFSCENAELMQWAYIRHYPTYWGV